MPTARIDPRREAEAIAAAQRQIARILEEAARQPQRLHGVRCESGGVGGIGFAWFNLDRQHRLDLRGAGAQWGGAVGWGAEREAQHVVAAELGGEPDIEILSPEDGGVAVEDAAQIRVRLNGVDVFKPQTGEVESSSADEIACWFIDTDYNGESFFVRQAYFLGANDPYKALKTTLKAEINEEAWATLNSNVSREFPKPKGGRIAVKVINHLGDEVMKVFRVE